MTEETQRLKKMFSGENFNSKTILQRVKMIDNADGKNNKLLGVFFNEKVKSFIENFIDIVERIEDKELDEEKGKKDLNALCYNIAEEGDELLSAMKAKSSTRKRIKELFRETISLLVYNNSKLLKRALDKPRGYPGDYKTIEINYRQKIVSDGVGAYFDNYFLTNKYAIAVRNRKDMMREILEKNINNSMLEKATNFNIINVGSGSACEIREIFQRKKLDNISLSVALVDFDEEALEFSKEHLENVPKNTTVEFIKEDLIKLLEQKSENLCNSENTDIFYSIGLADYLLDVTLEKFIKLGYGTLRKGGTLIIAHKDIDKDKATPICFDWFADWKFIPRNEGKMIELIENSGIKGHTVEVKREPSGVIFFMFIKKQ